jgi:hypothetical protein
MAIFCSGLNWRRVFSMACLPFCPDSLSHPARFSNSD